MENEKEVLTPARLIGLIKQKRNDDLKTIIQKTVTLDIVKKGESTFINVAVMYNNVELIAILFSFGFNINTRDSNGQTPLLIAARNNSYQAIQLLLALDADVFVDDLRGENAFRILLNREKRTPAYIIGSLSERLKRSTVSSDKIVEELLKADCPLENVLKLNNAVVMQEMLKRTNKMDRATSYALLERAMHSEDMNNVRVLLHYGPDNNARRERFIEQVTDYIFNPITKPFFEQIFNWGLIDHASLFRVQKYLEVGNEKSVQFVLDIGFEKYCKEKFSWSALVSLFYNENIDPEKVLRNRQFDMKNSRDGNGHCPLHVATMCENKRAVVYLLDNGADPNVEDPRGNTPLTYTGSNKEIAEILLEAGADIQAMSNDDRFFIANDFAIAHLMIAKARGIQIKDELEKRMRGLDEYGRYDATIQDKCELYILHLEWMKTRWVSESITLFFVLTEKFESLARHVKDEKTCEEILKAIKERSLKPTYVNMLNKNLKKAREMNELQVKGATFLCEKMQIVSDDHLVIRMILGFLTYKDLLVFDESEDLDGSAKTNKEVDDYIWWKKQEVISGYATSSSRNWW